MASEIELSWAAGFYEGEGSCGVWGNRRWNENQKRWYSPQLRVDVVQKRREPLDKLKEIFGFGSVLYDKHNDCFHYRTCAIKAKLLLDQIRPYIVNPQKQEQLDQAINKYITGKGGSCGV